MKSIKDALSSKRFDAADEHLKQLKQAQSVVDRVIGGVRVELKSDRVLLHVSNAAAASQVRYQQEQIKEALQASLGGDLVSVQIRIG